MANLPSDFWAGWITVITIVSLLGLAWLVYSVYFIRRSDAGVEHQVWDETLREGTAAAPLWWFWLIVALLAISVVYLMLYPTPLLDRYLSADPHGLAKVYQALCELTAEDLRNGGRVYGGGLLKMEPAELAALRATKLDEIVRPGA